MIIKNPLIASSGGGDTTTVKNLLDATKNAKYLFNEYKGTSIDELIKPNDTSNVTNMEYMFYYCSYLTAIPAFDTSKVTNMANMFFYCSRLSAIPTLNTSNVTNMYGMLKGCRSLTTIPTLDTSKVTSMYEMFSNCSKLTTIPALDVSQVTSMSYAFDYCNSLKSILMTGMKVNFNISASTKFERTDLVTILNNLATVTTSQTLTMGATNIGKLTDEDKAIATNKGWTLA